MIPIAQRLNLQTEIYRQLSAQLRAEIRVAMPGIVKAFNPTKVTVDVQPTIMEIVKDAQGQQRPVQLPVLFDVPVSVYRAGGFSMTLPIAEGDECMVIVSDTCINAWLQNGGVQMPETHRRHDLSDAMAIMGLSSEPRTIANYATDAAEIRSDDGGTKIRIEEDRIDVTSTVVTVTGSDRVEISGNGHTFIEGKDFLTHQHSGVASGGSISGPVVP